MQSPVPLAKINHLTLLATYMLISLCEKRQMIDFPIGNWILHRTWTGSGRDLDRTWDIGPDPARPGPAEAPPLSPAEHAPPPTHPHAPAHVDAIDFNTPR